MKKTRVCTFLAVVGLVTGVLLWREGLAQSARSKAPETIRTAVCNLPEVFKKYQRVQDLNAELRKREDQLQVEEDQKQKAFDQLEAELTVLSEKSPEYQKRLEDLLRQRYEFDGWKKTQDALILRWHYQLTKELFDEVAAVAGQVARQEGFQIVLSYQPGELRAPNTTDLIQEMLSRRMVLYSDESLDLTEAVISHLNLKYRSTTTKP